MQIKAPWTDEQVAALNAWQANDRVHPFTCANDHPDNRELVAHNDGWHCRVCDYRQDWAHDFMTIGP